MVAIHFLHWFKSNVILEVQRGISLVDMDQVGNTKERILLTAVRLFAERGYAAVSVRDIASSVNIRPAYFTIILKVKRLYLIQ